MSDFSASINPSSIPAQRVDELSAARGRFLALLVALGVFAAIAPALSWTEFSASMEKLNVATALEIRRSGNWLVPMLEGEPRIAKPPLAAWVTAAAIPDSVMSQLSSRDRDARDRAYRRLAFFVRASALLCSCVTLLLVYELGRTLADARTGLLAACVFASSYAFLRFAPQSNTDVQLMLWVTLTNLLIAKALIENKAWSGFIGAGLTLGLAVMSKGPVALVETIVPMIIFALWRRVRLGKSHVIAITLGLLAAIAVAIPWFAYIQHRFDVWTRWRIEVTRVGATGNSASNPLMYFVLVPMLLPWVVPLVIGMIDAGIDALKRRIDSRLVLALMLVVVPLVLMSFFHDRKDRYVLPMIPPAAVLAGAALSRHIWQRKRQDRWIIVTHWIIVSIIVIGLPLAGLALLKTINGIPWFSNIATALLVLPGLGIVVVGIITSRRSTAPLVVATMLVMLLSAATFVAGYRDSAQGRSDMRPLAETIVSTYPDADVINGDTRDERISTDFAIYLNRSTRRDANWRTIKATTRPTVVVLTQRPGDNEPTASAAWNFLGKVRRDDDVYYAYVLPPLR